MYISTQQSDSKLKGVTSKKKHVQLSFGFLMNTVFFIILQDKYKNKSDRIVQQPIGPLNSLRVIEFNSTVNIKPYNDI